MAARNEAVVRLEVNIAPDVADALDYLKRRRGTSYTEEVRRAISLLYFLEGQIEKGHQILIEDAKGMRPLLSLG
jgi:hypothetical protein